ncbi:unnamed protein product [Bemisia tabaci]|uniref:SWIM-type domain-containing protein n=1 Tax=Bemisia tabaci TaxID=7038 RepID=A0A9P0FA17_BEMTA|nr:PREDICTED: zinc finger SWIM domain-containing protein 7-like [Bemisia tabaci]CAH0394556.1 unnamed protein product [Bemisia tabaci]
MSKSPTLNVSLYQVWDSFWDQKLTSFGQSEKVPDDVLLALHSIHGSVLERAVELFDKDCLTVFRTKGHSREVLQIIGSSGMIYTLFHKINFCQCQSYKFQVLLYKANVTCKHVLAAALSYATGKFKVMELSSEDLTKLLIDSFVGRNEMQTSGHP